MNKQVLNNSGISISIGGRGLRTARTSRTQLVRVTCSTKCPSDPDATADMSGDPRVPPAVCRINALPDDMLLLILSYLNIRQVVQTCVLSRQWRNLWRSVPRINATPDEFEHMSDNNEECTVLFKKFVNRFLMLRNPVALEELRLWYDMTWEDDYPEDANLWICHALNCNARSVMVTVREEIMHLDPSVFISGHFLRRLKLASVALFPGFFSQLATGFTALKYLILQACDIFDVEITSKTLKVLIMDIDCHFTFEEQCSISIPSLVRLDYLTFQGIPLLKNMKSLDRACAVLNTHYHTEVDDISQFLKSLSGVTDLHFSYEGNMLNMGNIQWCPKFNNLTALTISHLCLHPDFYPLIVFLQNSPSLENLTLNLRGVGPAHPRFIGEVEERSFSCEHLHRIDIVCWEVQEHDPVLDNLVELLTDNGIEPDEIHISIWP